MRRLLSTLLVLAITGGAVVLLGAGGGDDGGATRYQVVFDNAFGLVEGGDVKVAGVRAGKIRALDLEPGTDRALVELELTEEGFGSIRRDVFCEIRAQSLIGEYFVDCRPGTGPELPVGSKIPVEQTASTIPADLVNNIMRRPYRERFRIILAELGAGVGGRAEDLNEAIRRAVPALRETDEVLAKLARQSTTLRDLTEDADRVITRLAGNKDDVARFVDEARDTARASAERRDDLAAGFRELPSFLAELEPTMRELGETADAQGGALEDLNAVAGDLETFFRRLVPFSDATERNLRTLATTSRTGRTATRPARATLAELVRATDDLPETANNLRIILEHLDDRKFAVEKDPRSPGGEGYTGLEALLQYPYDQALAINIYDSNGYKLKVNIFEDKCAEYQNAESVKAKQAEDPTFLEDCLADLGPTQQGVTSPDPTKGTAAPAQATSARKRTSTNRTREDERPGPAPDAPESTPARPEPSATPKIPEGADRVVDGVSDLLGGIFGGAPKAPVAPPKVADDRGPLLDFLLGR